MRDQNLPTGPVAVLTNLGPEAPYVKRPGKAEAEDRTLWSKAASLNAVMVGKDSDLVTSAGRGARRVRVRIGGRSNAALYAIVRAEWSENGEVMIDVHG